MMSHSWCHFCNGLDRVDRVFPPDINPPTPTVAAQKEARRPCCPGWGLWGGEGPAVLQQGSRGLLFPPP